MNERKVYSFGEEVGVIRLDSEGNIGVDGEESIEQPEAPSPPPEPEIDIEALQKEAYRQGYETGRQEAGQHAQQEINAFQQNMQKLAERIPDEIFRVMSQAEPKLFELALQIAKKIIQVECRQNSEIIQSVVRSAMEQVKNQTVIAIHLNPSDVEKTQPQFSDGRVELIPDPNIQPGGCRIETDLGELDATIATQIEMIERALREEHQDPIE